MIEPTESESKDELDRFCDALISELWVFLTLSVTCLPLICVQVSERK